jgi:hypothetical protein
MTGRADKDPLIKNDPGSPRNRRISIVLLRESYLKQAQTQPDDGPVQGNAAQGTRGSQPPQTPPETAPQTAQAPGPNNTGAPPQSAPAPTQAAPVQPSPAAAPAKASPATPATDGPRSDATPTNTPTNTNGNVTAVIYLEPADGPSVPHAKEAAKDAKKAAATEISDPAPTTPTPTINGIVVLTPAPKS